MQFNLDELSLDELELMEEATGLNILALPASYQPKTKHVKAFLWLRLKREQPDLTIGDVGSMPLGELMAMLPPDEAGPAPSPAGSRPSATSTAGSRRKRSGV